MKEIFHDSGFWGFATALIVSVRYLARVIYLYAKRNIIQKGQIDASVERLKTNNAIKLIEILEKTVSRIEPMVDRHEQSSKKLELAVKNLAVDEKQRIEISQKLIGAYQTFETRINNTRAGGRIVLERLETTEKATKEVSEKLDKIQTEIVALTGDKFWVRNKKP